MTFSKLEFFLNQNYPLYPQTHHFVIWSHRSCSLLRCHGNGCSWYSAILIIFTAKYQAWMDNYLCQISLILFIFGGVMSHNRRVRFFETRCRASVQHIGRRLHLRAWDFDLWPNSHTQSWSAPKVGKAELAYLFDHSGHFAHEVVTCQP